jgi:branched-subunit amino acid aminotransferase/4-amino-4-deoxychorismate lyase
VSMEFLIANGKVAGIEETNLNHFLTEPFFRLSQKVWYGYGGIPFFNENLKQIKNQTEALRLPFPKEFENQREMFRITKRMLNKNKFYRSGYLHFQVFWTATRVQTLVTANAFEGFDFPYAESGLLVTISNLKKNAQNQMNRLPFFNEMLWQAGLAEIRQMPFQQILFLNENNSVCESAGANIFLVKENNLITPALSTGCYEDILRPHVLDIAKHAGLTISETERLKKQEMGEVDEIFLASEAGGIRWVLGVENKRFLHYFSQKIYDLLRTKLNPNS